MYKVTCLYDGETYTLHDPLSNELRVYNDTVTTAKNDPGSFQFSVAYNHPYIDKIIGLSSYITVYDDDEVIFAGRPINDGEDIYRERTFLCEGELAFLYDSIQPRRELHDISPLEFFTLLIEEHNSQVAGVGPIDKTFTVGVVTVTDSNSSLYRYTNRETTLDDISDKIISSLGGYLNIRHENGVRYIDLLADVETVGDQAIQLGDNLLTFAKDTDYTEIATACIPLGAMLDESEISALVAYTTCADANDGNEVVQLDEAVENYGFICKILQYENATTAEYLLSAAKEWLTSGQYADMTLAMTAVDLHTLGYDLQPIRVNTQVRIVSKPHGMDRYAPVTERIYHLGQPELDSITIGTTEKQKSYTNISSDSVKTITEQANNTSKKIDSLLAATAENVTNLLNQATHGYVVLDPNDGPERILIMDTNSVDTASKIWKWDLNGLGYSSTGINGPWGTAITMYGQIVANYVSTGELDASLLKVGIIQDTEGLNYWDMETGELSLSAYATSEYTSSLYETAVSTAEGYTDTKLTEYSTTTEMNAAINTAVSNESASIQLAVSGTYATITSVTEAIETAEGYTDTKLTQYTTTIDMNAAISTAVSNESASILLTVSGTYATTSDLQEAVDSIDVSASLVLKVENGVGVMSGNANYISLTAGDLVISSGQFTLDTDGNATFAGTLSGAIVAAANIQGGAITTEKIAADAVTAAKIDVDELSTISADVGELSAGIIKSTNYSSTKGIYIDLDDGSISSPQFSIDSSGNATFAGYLQAASGSFSGDITGSSGSFSGTLTAKCIYADNIVDSAVTSSAIASGAVTYDKISVSELSSITADVGTLTAGVIKSANYVSGTSGVYIDLTNGTAQFTGDVYASSFSLDGVSMSVSTQSVTSFTYSSSGGQTSSYQSVKAFVISSSNGLVVNGTTYLSNASMGSACMTNGYYKYLYGGDLSCTSLDVNGSADIDSSLYVYGTANFYSSVGVSGALNVTGDITGQSNLGVFGNATVAGIVWCDTLSETSDSRLKTELESMDVYDSFFDCLNPGRFKYTFETSEQYHCGMYAQDVLESLKACGLTETDILAVTWREVAEDSPGYHGLSGEYGLNYMEFIPLTIYQLQKAKKRVSVLESEVEVLQAQIESIYEVMQASA